MLYIIPPPPPPPPLQNWVRNRRRPTAQKMAEKIADKVVQERERAAALGIPMTLSPGQTLTSFVPATAFPSSLTFTPTMATRNAEVIPDPKRVCFEPGGCGLIDRQLIGPPSPLLHLLCSLDHTCKLVQEAAALNCGWFDNHLL